MQALTIGVTMNDMARISTVFSRNIRRIITTKSQYLTTTRYTSTDRAPIKRIQDNGEWLHKANEAVKIFFYGSKAGTKLSSTVYHLSSRRPITPEIMHQALKILQRKLPNLQVGLKERDGEPWFYMPEKIDFDFQMYDRVVPKIDLVNRITVPFDDGNDPLWRCHVTPAADGDFCELPEPRRKEYPYSYLLVECLHHGVYDSVTGVQKYMWIIRILNTLLKGETITDMSPIGEFRSDEVYDKLFLECKERLMKDPERLEVLRQEILRANKTPVLYKAFPPPKVSNPVTKHLFLNVKKDILNHFIGKCKENGITIGNSLQMITSSALIEVVQDAGVDDDSYELSAVYSASIRRFMESRERTVLGFNSRTLTSLVTLQKNVRDNFWNNCQKLQQINNDLLKNKSNIEEDVMRCHFLPYVSPKDLFNSQPPVTRDLGFNNIGRVVTAGMGEDVMITSLEIYFLIHRSSYPLYNIIVKYDDDFRNMLSYATDCLSDETANSIALKMESLISYFSER